MRPFVCFKKKKLEKSDSVCDMKEVKTQEKERETPEVESLRQQAGSLASSDSDVSPISLKWKSVLCAAASPG